jgi:hypothetical protein
LLNADGAFFFLVEKKTCARVRIESATDGMSSVTLDMATS